MPLRRCGAQHEDEIDAIVENWLKDLPKAEATQILKDNRIPAAPVRDLVEVTADRHMHERGMLHDVVHPDMGNIVLPTSPLRFGGSPEPELRPEPGIGEHNAEVMIDWLDYDATRIEKLTAAGVLC